MRIQKTTTSKQLAKLIFDLIGISENFSTIADAIESRIKEENEEDDFSDENENRAYGWSYHEIVFLSEYQPQDCIQGILSDAQVETLSKFSDRGDLRVDVARFGGGRSRYEWSIELNIPKSPHMKDGETFAMYVKLSYSLGYKLDPKIESAWQTLDDEDLSKIYTAYSLVHL
jgi:hypothetical protein